MPGRAVAEGAAARTGSSRVAARSAADFHFATFTNPLDNILIKDKFFTILSALEKQIASGIHTSTIHHSHKHLVFGMLGVDQLMLTATA